MRSRLLNVHRLFISFIARSHISCGGLICRNPIELIKNIFQLLCDVPKLALRSLNWLSFRFEHSGIIDITSFVILIDNLRSS